jgi:hypothetical protein
MGNLLSTDHWALVAAVAAGGVAFIALCVVLFRRSARGQLRARIRSHRKARKAYRASLRTVSRAEAQLERLRQRAGRTKPRVLEAAKDAVTDARALAKIADDRQMVTANQVRKIIFEEFPPSRHEKLRLRHLPEDVQDERPFSFDA